MNLPKIRKTSTKSRKEERQKRIRKRFDELMARFKSREAIQVIADEECLAESTIYSILGGWR